MSLLDRDRLRRAAQVGAAIKRRAAQELVDDGLLWRELHARSKGNNNKTAAEALRKAARGLVRQWLEARG